MAPVGGFVRIKRPFAGGEPRSYKRVIPSELPGVPRDHMLNLGQAAMDGLVLGLAVDDRLALFLPEEWQQLKRVRPEAA